MSEKLVCKNRKAQHEYEIEEVYQAGIVLLGPEVKSLREGRANLKDSYARIKSGEIFLYNMHISPYPHAHNISLDPTRVRKLLLKKREIKRLIGKTQERGYTLIPIKVYFSGKWAKVDIALARGRKKIDKRRMLKERELKKEMDQFMKKHKY